MRKRLEEISLNLVSDGLDHGSRLDGVADWATRFKGASEGKGSVLGLVTQLSAQLLETK